MDSVTIIVSVVLVLIEIWWAAAFAYAYVHLRRPLLLVQVAQGLLIAAFFIMLTINSWNGMAGISPAQLLVLVLALITVVIWRSGKGPELLRQRYTNRRADVLRFRRPSVDMRRRVRTR